MSKPLKTFIIYAREDAVFKNELLRQLAPFAQTGLIEKWDDSHILPGEEWEKSIEKALESSQIVLMLVSADSLFSDFIQRKELKKALEQKREGATRVIPILIRDCLYDMAEGISDLQMLPLHPVSRSLAPVDDLAIWGSRASAWAAALRQLREVVSDVHARIEAEEKVLLAEMEKIAALAAEAQRAEEAATAKALAAKEAEARREKDAKLQRSKDEAAWKAALELDTLEAYEDYIRKYNLHEEEAHERVGKLEAAEAKIRAEKARKAKEAEEKRKREEEAALAAKALLKEAAAAKAMAAKEAALKNAREAKARKAREDEEKKRENADPFADLMIPIKGGTYDMGDTFGVGNASEKPIHTVTVRDYYISKYPVTQAQWEAFMKKSASSLRKDDYPIEGISWDEVQEFCKKINEKTGKKYRLPNEIEWEYAAKGGANSKGFKYSGSNQLDEVAWYDENAGSKTHPVGQKKPNELGIFDMSGNVSEWLEDDWHSNYNGAPIGGSAWVDNPRASHRVVRGGGISKEQFCRVAHRSHADPRLRYINIGFRLALDLE